MRDCTPMNDYNKELFGSNRFRAYFHQHRFRWLVQSVRSLGLKTARVVELGCFDAKSVRALEQEVTISRYLGLDAGWGGGLELGRQMWKDRQYIELQLCKAPGDIGSRSGETFDLGIAMETLEHIPSDLLEPYLKKLASLISGYFLVTVPIERGPVFFCKHIVKKALRLRDVQMTWTDFVYSALGRLDRVRRDEHLGFDDRILLQQLSKYFDIVEVRGLAPSIRPAHWNFGVGIICKARELPA